MNGAIVIIMRRLHEDDPVGHVIAPGEWEVVSIPAIATEQYRLGNGPEDVSIRGAGEVLHPREPLEVLEAIRRTQGNLVFSA